MNKKVVLLVLILSSLLLILGSMSIAFVKAQGVELFYDDGTPETGWSWPIVGGMFAVRFTPPTSGQLLNCRFYIRLNPETFNVHVLDADKNDMITPFPATPTSTGWFYVDLSTYGITVSQDVDFYVAMETTVVSAPALGDDTSAPDGRSEHCSDYIGGEWSLYDEGDYMIRAVIEPSYNFDEYFWSVDYTPFDSNSDGYNDAIEVKMDVDVTDNGNVAIEVYAFLIDQNDTAVDLDVPQWSIDGVSVEYGYAYLYVPSNSSEGWYDVELYLIDELLNSEDYWKDSDVAYLYPPVVNRTLTVQMPYSGVNVNVDGVDYETDTDNRVQVTVSPGSCIVEIPTYISTGSGSQAVFVQWSDGNSSNPRTILVNNDLTLTAEYKTQYYLTMNTGSGTVTPGSGWYDTGVTVQITATDPTATSDERYAWAGWTGTGTGNYAGMDKSATITMNGPITETAKWTHEYYLTVTSSSYGSPTSEFEWVEAGKSLTMSANSPASGPSGTRYLCTGWTGTGSVPTSGTTASTTFTMDKTSSITWNWKTQYYLTLNAGSGTVTPSSGWYDTGVTVQISATDPAGTSSERYAWAGWTGTGTGSYSGTDKTATITMNGPITETAALRHEYYLTVTSPYGSPTPGSGWVEAGKYITVSVPSSVPETSDIRYACCGWTGTGSVPTSGTSASTTFTMNEPSSITWNWKTQYCLTMDCDCGTVTPGTGWYDAGATVQISATEPPPISGKGFSWLGWNGTGTGNYTGTDKSAAITMNGPITEIASWEEIDIRPPTTIQLILPSEPIELGKAITVSGYITPAHEATVTLTYTLPDGSKSNKTVTALSDGTFTHTYTLNTEGSWSVTASCLGDADYLGTKSSIEQFTVDKDDQKDNMWDILQVVLAVVGIAVSFIFVGATFFSRRRKRGQIKNLLDEIDDVFFRFKRNSRRCEAELYRLKDIVLEQYKGGKITEGSYVILNERVDDYISKLSQP